MRYSAFALALNARQVISASLARIALIALCLGLANLTVAGAAQAVPLTGGGADKAAAKKSSLVRLSKDVLPVHYDLTVEPDMRKFTFAGSEQVTVSVGKATREIVLNAADIDCKQAEIIEPENKKEKAQIVFDKKSERMRLLFKNSLPAGTYKIDLKFTGNLNDQLKGFYRSAFEDDKHVKHWLCTTQMEAIDARRMFPCFDEPEFKATFHIKTIIDPTYAAISNCPIEKEESLQGKKAITFETTPKMSSYLVALVIGELGAGEEKVVDGVPIKVWTVKGKEHLGKFALEEAARILAFESKYFGIAFPTKKLDLIAIPDFAAGAMENLGAITFRDSDLLTDDQTGSLYAREEISSVVAHEMAHQWFGDLVTMRWWDDLWLNEAFASWMATKTTDALHPEWRVMTETVSHQPGMSTDALRTTRAIHADVTDVGQVEEMFDSITYGKGESVLRMLENFVGPDRFEKGVHKYLTDHSFANATTDDLWQAVAACAPGVPVPQIMKTFIYQPGVPLVYASLGEDGRALKVSQTRYFPLGDDKKDKSLWLIPLAVRQLTAATGASVTAGDSKAEGAASETTGADTVNEILKKNAETIALKNKWPAVVVNAGGTGYYHVCYSRPLLKSLESGFKNLTVEEKLIATNDVASLTLSGRVPIEESYNFALNLPHESDPLVLKDLLGYFYSPHDYMTGTSKLPYEKLIRYMAGPVKQRVGWTEKAGETEADKQLRISVLNLLGTYGQDKVTIKEAFDLFGQYLKDHKSVGANIIDVVFGIVSYNGSPKEYDQMLALYRSAQNPEDKNRALYHLPGFRKNELAKRTLLFAMSKEVRLQDGLNLLNSVAVQKETRAIGWTFIEQHWSEIVHRFPENSLRSLSHAGATVETRAQEAEVRSWFASHTLPKAESAIARMKEGMNLRMLRRERYGTRVRNWILAQAAKLPHDAQ